MHFYNVSIIDSFQCTMFESFEQKNGFCIVVVVVAIFLYQSASAQYPTIFSFFFFSCLYYFLFFLLVEHRVGKFTKVFQLTISFTDGSSIECIKGVVVAWAWHPYNRLSPAQYEFVFLLTISASSDLTRFQDFLGIPRILAMKYACCAAKAKVMWLTWMLVMLCRLLLLLLLLGLRLSLKKIEMKIII